MQALLILGVLLVGLAGCGVPSTTSCDPAGEIEPVCGLQAPEDLAPIPWTRWLLVSQMASPVDPQAHPGSLAALHLETGEVRTLYPRPGADDPRPGWGDPACPGPPGAAFAPHGIDVQGSRLLVVGHGGREAVEVFELEVAGDVPSVSWRGCAIAPADASLNDVAALPQGFAATKMLDREAGWGLGTGLAVLRGSNTGHVLIWEPDAGWSQVPNSEGAGPNGITTAGDGSVLFYSEFFGQKVVRIARSGEGRAEFALDFKPDNLTWTAAGRLLAAGTAGSLREIMACSRVPAGACQSAFRVAEINPLDGTVRELLRSDGAAGGGISVALRLGDTLYLGSFAGDRLLRAKLGG